MSDANKELAKKFLEKLLHYTLDNCKDIDGLNEYVWKDTNKDGPKLTVRATLNAFMKLLVPDYENLPDDVRGKHKDNLSRLINKLEELDILNNHIPRPTQQGSENWHFSLNLPTKSVPRHLSHLEEKLENESSSKSKAPSSGSKEVNDTARSPDAIIQPNLFGDTGQISDPNRFHGRKELLRQILETLSKGNSVSLVGEPGVGKSSILQMICKSEEARLALPPEKFEVIYLDMQYVEDWENFVIWLCDAVGIAHCRDTQLEKKLSETGKHYILCLDEIHNMADFKERQRDRLRSLADGCDKPITLVTASQVPLEDLFPDSPWRKSPLANLCKPIDVKPFSDKEAREFLAERLKDTGISFSNEQINELLVNSGREPKRLQSHAAELYDKIGQKGSNA